MSSDKTDKKPLIRLKEAIRFEYTPETMASLAAGEIGRVVSSAEDRHEVIFGKNSIVPDKGIPTKAHRIWLPFSVCETVWHGQYPNVQSVSLPEITKARASSFSGKVLHCLACNRIYEAPEDSQAKSTYHCPGDKTQLISLVHLTPLADANSAESFLQCPMCNERYVIPESFGQALACPKDSKELIRRQRNAVVVQQSGPLVKVCISGLSGRVYELEEHPFEADHATELFRARCLENNGLVICKILRAKFRDQAVWKDSLNYELNYLKELAHDGLPVCVDESSIEGVPILMMENMNCQSLYSIMQKQPGLQAYHALLVAARVCQVLQYLDSRGLHHPDLKASDVLISNDRSIVKLFNFHTPSPNAKVKQEFNEIMGEQASFACPDLMKGKTTMASNVYSLGCLLYFMLVGTLPFRGGSLIEIARKQMSGSIPRLRDVRKDFPIALDELVANMMSISAEKRPTLDQVEQALSQISRQVG